MGTIRLQTLRKEFSLYMRAFGKKAILKELSPCEIIKYSINIVLLEHARKIS